MYDYKDNGNKRKLSLKEVGISFLCIIASAAIIALLKYLQGGL